MVDTILCIDSGTTSLKAALLSDKCTVEAYSRQPFAAPGAEAWFGALGAAVRSLKEQNPGAGIEAVCVSGNGPSLVADCGADGQKTLLWNEPPSAIELAALNDAPQTRSLFIPRFRLLKERHSAAWSRAGRIFSGPEYLIFRLTGTALSILPGERYESAYWSRDELVRCGFSADDIEKIPPFVRMGAFAGTVSANAAITTGLLEGTLVFCGAPDFIVALLGTGAVFPGTVCDRAGSSEGLNLCTDTPLRAPGVRTLPHPVPGLWNAGVLIEQSGTRIAEGADGKAAVLEAFVRGIETLRSLSNGAFPRTITMTGGQCADEAWIRQKAERANVRIDVPWCADAELIGDLILARVALGDFDDIQEAALCLCKAKKSYGNI